MDGSGIQRFSNSKWHAECWKSVDIIKCSSALPNIFLPPANVVCEGYVFTPVCDSVNGGVYLVPEVYLVLGVYLVQGQGVPGPEGGAVHSPVEGGVPGLEGVPGPGMYLVQEGCDVPGPRGGDVPGWGMYLVWGVYLVWGHAWSRGYLPRHSPRPGTPRD